MKTHDELYNAICDRLNELLPERLELKFGTHVIYRQKYDTLLGNLHDTYHLLFEGVIPKKNARLKILGTPPTLQEILYAIQQKRPDYITNLRFEIGGAMYFTKDGEKYKKHLIFCNYDLTKPVKEQETSTLQAIYDLLV